MRTRRTTSLAGYSAATALALVCLAGLPRQAPAQGATYQLQSAQGQVLLQARGQGAGTAVRRGTHTANSGDRIRTGPNGSVHIVTATGQRLVVGPSSEVILKEPNKPTGWRVLVGKAIAILTGGRHLEVRAPGAVAAAEGTTFQVEVAEDGTTVLTVVEGQVRFYNDLGDVVVLASQQSTARPGTPPTRPVVIDPSGVVAWEADLKTLVIEPECPQVGTDPDRLQQELDRRQQALREHPDDPAAQEAVTEVLLDLRHTDEALAQAQKTAERAAGDAVAQGLLGFALLQAGRPGEAADRFAAAAAAQPESARWQIGLALVALGQRDCRPAASLLQRAAQLAPGDPLPRAYLTAVGLRLGDLPAASASAAEAARLGPDHYLANTYLAYVRFAEGRLDEAVPAATKAVQEAPRSALARQALATTHFFAGDYDAARQDLAQALALDPLSAAAHLTLSKLLAAQGELGGALDEAEQAVCLEPESAPAHSTLGLLFLLNHDPQRAGREFGKALALNPDLAEAHTGWGMILARRGRFREALNEQKAALALDTSSASAENNLGGVAASLGHMDEAITHLKRAIELQPGWGMPHANLAVVYLEQNLYANALASGEEAVALGERSAFAHTVLARIYERQGRRDRALAELREAVALDDTYPQAHYQLAQLYLKQDRARDAVRDILTALTVDPSAMVETRQYARTEVTASGGSYGSLHLGARHSSTAADGRVSYFAGGLAEQSTGWRKTEQDSSQWFGEAIAGYQPRDTEQLVLWTSGLSRRADLPGPATAAAAGDRDDRGAFRGVDAVVAFRQRLARGATVTAKYSYRRSDFHFRNPDSLTKADVDPFRDLVNIGAQQTPEVRMDLTLSRSHSLSAGYSHMWDGRQQRGVAGAVDPKTGAVTYRPFASRATPEVNTAWLEEEAALGRRLRLTLGGYVGGQSGSPTVVLPKAVVLYRPDRATWVSAMAIPIFRNDAAELSPVEALADPAGLGYLSFVEGGAGRSYELRVQRTTSRSATLTASAAYQRVRGLLVDTQDAALAALPTRVLIDRGQRWVTEASYEQWLSHTLTGRAFLRWQDSQGIFPEAHASGTQWPYAPHLQTGGRLDYIDTRGYRVGLEAVWVGRRFGDAANTRRVPGYAVLNLRAQYQRSVHECYFVDLTNLADRRYVTFDGFPQPGRAVVVGLDYRF